jgi:hypothetical protein
MLSRKKGNVNEGLKKGLQRILAERAKIRDMAAGIPNSVGGGIGLGAKELVERLRILTAHREQVALQTRIAQIEAEMKAEICRLEEETERAEQRFSDPLSLTLLTPVSDPITGQSVKVARGAKLDIRWDSTGPTGDKLRIGLLKGGIYLRGISFGAPIDGKIYSWQIPPGSNPPPANDYQVSIQDVSTGLSAISDSFQIT